MAYEYISDDKHLRSWLEVEKDPAASRLLDRYIYGVADFDEYLERCGGLAMLKELRSCRPGGEEPGPTATLSKR